MCFVSYCVVLCLCDLYCVVVCRCGLLLFRVVCFVLIGLLLLWFAFSVVLGLCVCSCRWVKLCHDIFMLCYFML